MLGEMEENVHVVRLKLSSNEVQHLKACMVPLAYATSYREYIVSYCL